LLLSADEREIAERFLDFLIRDGRPIHLLDGRTTEQKTEFRALEREDRKKLLRVLRQKRKNEHISAEEKQKLDGLEGSSVYSNRYMSVTVQKPIGKKARGNLEEAKRLYVADRIFRLLNPEKNRYQDLRETYEPHSDSRGREMRLRRFERTHISFGKLTCQQVVEEQFDRFKSNQVKQAVADNRVDCERLTSATLLDRWRFHQELRGRLRRTELETSVLSRLWSDPLPCSTRAIGRGGDHKPKRNSKAICFGTIGTKGRRPESS
jgi:hypothetical protein